MKQNYSMSGNASRNRLRNPYHLLLTLVLFVFGSSQIVQAQKMEKLPGPIIVCPAKFEDQNSRMAMSQMASKKLLSTKKSATAELLVTFGPGAQANPEATAAFQFALDIWAEEIVSNVPIRIFAEFADLGPGVLASAGPTTIFSDFEGAPVPGVFYPAALADALAGVDLDPDEEFDLVVNLGNGIPWYFGTDGNTPAGLFDFVTVALHEAGHGLGFIDGGDVDENGVGSLGFAGGIPIIFDTFIVNGEGTSVLDLPNPSLELGDFYTSGDVFVNGTRAVAALGGTLPELFAPNPFQGGSSIAHWDEATFPAGDPNSLMSPQVGTAESNFDIGDITRGHFSDMGWVFADAAPIVVIPGSISEELNVDEIVRREISISNVSDASVTVSPSASTDASVIELFDPESVTVAATEVATLEVQFNTTGLPKGIYEEEIILDIEGSDVSVTIPVTIRVLDGTEVPIITVSPESFEETIEQLQVVTRDLTLENTGDDNLTFNITVNDQPQITFANRVATSMLSIETNGFNVKNFPAASASPGISSLIQTGKGTFSNIISSLLATGFEEFAAGNIDEQFGWSISTATETDDWEITNVNAFEGSQHIRSVSDGSGGTRLAFSPTVTPGDEPFMVTTSRINIQGSGTTWQVIPQSPTAGFLITRVTFNPDGSIAVQDAATGAVVQTGFTTPSGYFDLRIVVDKDDFTLTVFIDDQLIFSGAGFAGEIEQVVFLSNMETAGSTMDIDNFEIVDGDPNAFFLTVSPAEGVVPFGSSTVAEVKFDTRILDPGTYNATINVSSNDTTDPSIDIPVSLTVLTPPTITVAPDALSAAVDVQTDDPPTQTETFTISNSGENPLEFTTALGPTIFTLPSPGANAALMAALDLSKYGAGNTDSYTFKSVKSKREPQLRMLSRTDLPVENATVITDSIFYDSGISFPDSFGGLEGPAIATAIKFDAESDFTLTAVRNAYRTETLADVAILLEVYRGGATPDLGELLLQQTVTTTSETGVFLLEELTAPLPFEAGESFWVVHKYPEGIDFPQGQDDDISSVRPDTYFFSSDGGESYTNLTANVFLTRALSSAGDEAYISLEPSSGTVAAGESVEVSVTFDGQSLTNGTFQTDILVNSNDPVTPTAAVATTFEVSGQISGIEVSDELLTFNDVFIGNSAERTFTITNTGLAQLNVNSIVSDNTDFVPEVSSTVINGGEEQEITVTFSPSSVGSINGIISITSDAPDVGVIDLIVNGIGVDPPTAILDPLEVSESTDTGTTVDTEITLRNDGSSPLVFSFPEFTMAAAMANPNAQISSNADIIDYKALGTPQKGFKDTRIGAKVANSMGMDNEFGYTWIDSDEVGGPVYFPFDISATGFDLSPFVNADDTVELSLPYPIEFYGITYESIFISANGFVSFQAPTTPFTFFNEQIPVDDGVNNVIAGFWSDLEPQNGGAVHIEAFADAVVVQWTNAPIFFGAPEETVTFKIIIFADGTIDIFYDDVDGASFVDQGTVGIENADGSDGAQVAFNTPYIKDGLALRFIAPDVPMTNFISSVSPLSGVVPAGGSRTLTVTLDATDLDPDVYFDELTVSSNAPDKSSSTALIELTVLDVPRVSTFTLVNADTNEEIGPLNEGDVIDLADFDANSFNVVANIGEEAVGSVVFDFNGDEGFRTESTAPYALGGDSNGNFRTVVFPLGTNTITATPFTERGGRGDAGIPLTVNFEVVDVSDDTAEASGRVFPNPVENVANFALKEGTKQTLKGTLHNLMGQMVYPSFDFAIDDQGSGFLDMTDLPQGTYIFTLRDASGEVVSQVKMLKK
ncbi:MAG: choice-of-anchor D domain-containing protein [Saonia sp.]